MNSFPTENREDLARTKTDVSIKEELDPISSMDIIQSNNHLSRNIKIDSNLDYGASKKIYCEQCSYSSTYKQNLKLHIKSVHEKVKDFNCSKCEYSSADGSHLKHTQIKKFLKAPFYPFL